jgi:hypothetical protein
MSYARDYSAAEALKLINKSEHLVVREGRRGTAADFGVDDDYTAHTVSRHLLKGSPGALGQGVANDVFRDRFLGSPENKNSGWAGKGEMALLLSEALNSEVGQFGLGQFDKGVSRVMIHYLNLGKLRVLTGGVKLKEASYDVTPAKEIIAMEPIINSKTNLPIIDPKTGLTKTKPVKTITPRTVTGKVTAADIASVNVILDRFGAGELHLQTFFPSSEASESYCEWMLGMVKIVAANDHGKWLTRASVNWR